MFSQEVLVPNKAHGSVCPTFILVRDLGKSLVGFSHDFRMGECKKKTKTHTHKKPTQNLFVPMQDITVYSHKEQLRDYISIYPSHNSFLFLTVPAGEGY